MKKVLIDGIISGMSADEGDHTQCGVDESLNVLAD